MSLDRTLKTSGGLVRKRSVLKRSERLAVLHEEGQWKPGETVFGLPKVKTVISPTPLSVALATETPRSPASQSESDSMAKEDSE